MRLPGCRAPTPLLKCGPARAARGHPCPPPGPPPAAPRTCGRPSPPQAGRAPGAPAASHGAEHRQPWGWEVSRHGEEAPGTSESRCRPCAPPPQRSHPAPGALSSSSGRVGVVTVPWRARSVPHRRPPGGKLRPNV